MAHLKRISLPDQLYEELRRRIISLELPLGSRLNASELQKEFNVSSTPVREALNRLSQEGLVGYENNIGARVLDLTEKDVSEITEVNFALQAEAVRLAVRKGNSGEIIAQVEARITACETALTQESILENVTKISEAFFALAGNDRLSNNTCGLAAHQKILIGLCLKALKHERESFLVGLMDYRMFAEALRNEKLNEAVDILEKMSYTGRDYSIRGLALLKQ